MKLAERWDGGLQEQRVREASAFIRENIPLSPSVALVLGSGLGDFAQELPAPRMLRTQQLPHFPVSTVEGHKGEVVISPLGSTVVMAFCGRVHLYESGALDTVLFPLRVALELGARTVLLTNAAGGVNRKFQPGDLMLITDHLNLTGTSAPHFGGSSTRMNPVYDPELLTLAEEVAEGINLPLHRGVYAGVKGPSYETAAEIEMVYRLGGDAVGMSTVLEAEAARSLGARVLGISCITNKATGTSTTRLDHSEVTLVANRVKKRFASLLHGILNRVCMTHA